MKYLNILYFTFGLHISCIYDTWIVLILPFNTVTALSMNQKERMIWISLNCIERL